MELVFLCSMLNYTRNYIYLKAWELLRDVVRGERIKKKDNESSCVQLELVRTTRIKT